MNNPYWEAVEHLPRSEAFPWGPQLLQYDIEAMSRGDFNRLATRKELCAKYSWAVPDPDTVTFVADQAHGDIVEIGAGTGYWAHLLQQLGVDVAAYDSLPPCRHENHWHGRNPCWTTVKRGFPSTAARFPDRTLFLCWPPYGDPMARKTLTAYTGERLIYVGEDRGCTADEAFHDQLEDEWRLVAACTPVQWEGMHDNVRVYVRKP